MPPLFEWQTFLAVQAGAAATLTGLVFVAVSLNLSRILTVAGLAGRAAESILQLLQVFFVASVALVPRQSTAMLAGEIQAIGLASWIVQVISQVRYAKAKSGHPITWLLSRVIMTQLSTVPFCVASILFFIGNPNALSWLVLGFLFSFVAGVLGAWILLVEILR